MIRYPILSLVLLMCSAGQAEEKWWPSKWGAEDTLGSFNMLGTELTLKFGYRNEQGYARIPPPHI